MLARQRHRIILNMLSSQASLRTIELAKYFEVTDETIRRDLEQLDEEKKLIRTHGGCIRIEKGTGNLPLNKRLLQNHNLKCEIAKKALEMIKENDTLLFDASSTALVLAEMLPDIRLTVITNAHDIVLAVMDKSNITVILTGGRLDRESHSFGGFASWQAVKRYSVDLFFFSCNGVDIDRGASEAAEMHAEFKENVLPFCSKKVLLCDSSKLNARSISYFAPLDKIDVLVTDSAASPEALQPFESAGLKIV